MTATRTGADEGRARPPAPGPAPAPAAPSPGTTGVRRTISYLPGLDGVRALAVVAVLAFHGGMPWAQGGFLGVSTFFTLSGFLITSLLLVDARALALDPRPDRRGVVVGFWRRRIRRLLPASLVGILIGLVFALTVGSVEQQRAIPGDALGSLLDVANWRFVLSQQSYGDIFAAPSPLQHYWSLSIEEQFYLVFPLVLIAAVTAFGAVSTFARRRFGRTPHLGVRAPFLAVSLVLLGLSILATVAHSGEADRVYYGTDTRAAEVLVGCLLAIALSGRGRVAEIGSSLGRTLARVLGVVALVGSLACWWLIGQTDARLAEGGFIAYALMSAALVAGATVPGPLSRALSIRPLRWIGAISFGLYVYHWPVFLLLDSERTGLGLYPLLALRLAVTAVIAVASARWLERPIRSGRRPVWLPVRLRIVTPAVAAAILALALVAQQTAPAPEMDFEAAQSQFENELSDLDLASSTGDLTDPAGGVPATLPKPPMGPVPAPWITVFGDLSGKRIANLLTIRQQNEDREDVAFADGVYDRSCSLLRGTKVRDTTGVHPNFDACERRNETWPTKRASTGADVTVVSIGLQDLLEHDLDGSGTFRAVGDPIFDARVSAELDDMIAALTTPDSTIVLANLPTDWSYLGDDRPWLLDADSFRTRAQIWNGLIAAAVARHPEVALLDLDGWISSVGLSMGFLLDSPDASPAALTAFVDWVATRAIEVNQAAAQRRYDAQPNPVASEPASGSRPTRVLVAGDSTAVALAVGLRGHAAAVGDIEVGSVARLNCALAPGGVRRNGWGEQQDNCPDDEERVRAATQRFQPDVVVVVDVLWEVTDRKIPGDDTWRTLGDPVYEQFLRQRLGRMYDALTVTGAHLALVQYPLIETGRGDATRPDKPYPANEPARMERWNALMAEMVAGRTGASVIDLRSWVSTQPGGELDPGFRPDGLHYNTESGRAIADGFLAEQLIERSRR